jgi:hypothetical protein
MNEERELKHYEDDETVEINIEELTEVQGGIEDEYFRKGDCGLGCFLGAGYGPIIS